jgi:hypothetical protein
LFVFARHAESTANAAHVLSSDPSRPVALTARGRVQACVLGTQLANVPVDLAVGTRLLRTRQTIDIALHGRQIPVLIEPGFDELQAGDLDGAPIQAYRSWKHLHAPDSRFPHGESPRMRSVATRMRCGAFWRERKRSRWWSFTSSPCGISRWPPRPTGHACLTWSWATQFRISSTNVPSSALPPAWTRWPGPGSLGNSLGDTDWPVASDFTVRG